MVEIPTSGKVRLDAWLWSVRIYKTRSAATAACRAGHVRLNGDPVKASQNVVAGDRLRVRKDGFDRDLEITGLLSKRVSAPVATKCYLDHTPPRERVVIPQVPVRERGAGRPTKKDRREMDRLRTSWQEPDTEL
ncbi:RNA-binding S4 domain-containing protein [Glutamicibacter halophytocola]|uniref:RNA-binding S4 domain-containing protein n=1 Tax=Glutamicibacter halophytocola TaxID=1933880 RepID=A0ABX5Y895_9MICC|nr:RNA-binding S4 domain-containing protein [Glutamicibacter halophytocola]QDY66187.1 RNA-binding S4 domain-containing protein [Glutamicibacter halophytocola]